MAKKFSARRYARAIFDIAQESNELNEWLVQLDAVSQLNRDETVVAYLDNPSISFQEKEALLAGKLPGINARVINMVYLLLDSDRVDMLPAVVNEYKKMLDQYNGIERAEVITAVPLDDKSRQKLSDRLSEIIGKKILIEPEYTDRGLIGGVVVKVGGKMLDGSTRNALNVLKKEVSS
ncbi:MAG: F0F1 ATP synthase subunit delta [Dehalococcoidales bacterium]|nr:F0F1 ATP synthase subunit delta [Dehalococcoidales bacterium]